MSEGARRRWLTKREAAEYLGLTVRALRRVVLPEIPVAKIGGRRSVDIHDLDRWRSGARERDGHVYLVEISGGPVKVGFTGGSVDGRLQDLQIGCPYELRVAASFRGSRFDELEMHGTLSDLRMQGEWFSRAPIVSGIIRRAQECGANPLHEDSWGPTETANYLECRWREAAELVAVLPGGLDAAPPYLVAAFGGAL